MGNICLQSIHHTPEHILKALQFKDPSLEDDSNKYIRHFTQLIGTHKIAVGWPLTFTLNLAKSTGAVVTWVRWTNTPTKWYQQPEMFHAGTMPVHTGSFYLWLIYVYLNGSHSTLKNIFQTIPT